ncbi:MAG: hypothetical protein KUA37_07150 [Desulfomicrobium sp.]|nr:hypothetical protein [Pseudomonadota bacterium]MBV1711768.1 hypothetical protein [Desulfomicrobium sp.]MBU4572644.1 hypothetical protein [Pseudomonadota bacterium]MBU4593575.1 hypothetical protein [Pseudomonadota bacterium]MBV1719170.1 hypothetical protein [Desulfomicrobium sp.]
MSKISERLQKLEKVNAASSGLPQLVLWKDMDGSYSYDGQRWASIDDIFKAYPNKYNPDNVMSFSWKGAAKGEA